MKLKSLALAAAVAGMLVGANAANANSIEISVGSPTVTPTVGGFNWAYDLYLTPSNTVVSADPTGSFSDSVVSGSTGSVAVFYDIAGLFGTPTFTGGVNTPTGDWAMFVSSTSLISSDATTLGTPDSATPNVVAVYTGPGFTNGGAVNAFLGTVTFSSTIGLDGAALLRFGARDYDARVPNTNANSQGLLGPTVIPVPAAAWTGLTTLAGLAGLGIIRRRRNA